jgi:hypothetical protein
MMTLKIVSASALVFAFVGAASVAAPIAQSGGTAAEAANQFSTVQTVARRHVRCNRSCQRGPVEEWGGVVRWHRHVGPECRPVRCTPR